MSYTNNKWRIQLDWTDTTRLDIWLLEFAPEVDGEYVTMRGPNDHPIVELTSRRWNSLYGAVIKYCGGDREQALELMSGK